MKILTVCQHYWPENFRVTEICETLVRHGHEVTVLVGLPNYPTGIVPKEYRWFRNRRQERNGVKIIRCFEIGRWQSKIGLAVNYLSYMLSACIKGLFLKKDYDVIYAFSTSPVLMSYPGVFFRKLFRKKMLIYVLDIWPACLSAMNVKEDSFLYKIMKRVSKHIYSSTDTILYSSLPFQQYLEKIHGIHVPDQNYLPQFADDPYLLTELDNKGDLQKTEMVNLVFTGNIGKVQAVDNLIRAASLLKEAPIRWHIVGDGTMLEECKALAAELKLSQQVFFYGRLPVEQMSKFYHFADALIVSMKQDLLVNYTLPGKVQSYMASGKPILAPIAGETARVIAQAKAGICCSPDDPDALMKAVRKFLSLSDESREKMGKNARTYYEKYFSKEVHMEHLEQALQELNNGGDNI